MVPQSLLLGSSGKHFSETFSKYDKESQVLCLIFWVSEGPATPFCFVPSSTERTLALSFRGSGSITTFLRIDVSLQSLWSEHLKKKNTNDSLKDGIPLSVHIKECQSFCTSDKSYSSNGNQHSLTNLSETRPGDCLVVLPLCQESIAALGAGGND